MLSLVVVAALALGGFGLRLAGGGLAGPTRTPTSTLPPTSTLTPTPTATPTATPLVVATLSSDQAAMWALGAAVVSPTPTNTATPAPPTETPVVLATDTPAPTATTLPPLVVTPLRHRPEFELRGGQLVYEVPNAARGCAWQAIAGQVVTKTGAPISGYNLHLWVFGARGRNAISGSRPEYGESGFEFLLSRGPQETRDTYYLQLQDPFGVPASDIIAVPTFADCERAVTRAVFVQVIP